MDTLLTYFPGQILCLLSSGLIVLGLYGANYLKRLKGLTDSCGAHPLLLAFSIILSAWFVGLVIETAAWTGTYFLLHSCQLVTNPSKFACGLVHKSNIGNGIVKINEPDMTNTFDREDLMMTRAADYGFRNLTLISFFTLLLRPKISSEEHPELKAKWPRWYSIVGMVVFGACWCFAHFQAF
jgi:hypothetical protein